MGTDNFSTKFVDKSWVFPQLDLIKTKIRQKIGETTTLDITEKKDKSFVTEIDLFVCRLIKENFLNEFGDLNYFSEEDQETFMFPMIILDPIDGTRELIAGIGECAVSFGIYFSKDFDDDRNFSWIYNPFTEEEISSESNIERKIITANKTKYEAMVSRSEFEAKLHDNYENLEVKAVGSIANKLMLLSLGKTEVVISKKPKNIWDIMAGSHICHKNGIQMYINNKPITGLDQINYGPNFVWTKYPINSFHI